MTTVFQAATLLGARVIPPDAADRELGALCCHPQQVSAGDCFGVFAEYFNHNEWFAESVAREAACAVQPAVVIARAPIEGYRGTLLQVPDPRSAFALLARAEAGAPDSRMPVIGVTGTNGKTTTCHLIAHLVEKLAGTAGCMGTLGSFFNGRLLRPGAFTTGLALPNMEALTAFEEMGASAVAMEVSSHGLALDRVAGLSFRVGVLTNLARDHLDFHRSQEAYAAAKERLFRELDERATAVLNADDPSAARMMAATRARVVTFGWGPTSDWRVEDCAWRGGGATVTVVVNGKRHCFETQLVGRFQVANILAAAAATAQLGYPEDAVLSAASDFQPVSGRMEKLSLASGATAIIDYAHNPDGLQNLLTNCRAMEPRRLLLVFGCGGDRDRGKRPLMGEIAERGADCLWVTSDNPRTEEPEGITGDILQGMREPQRARVEPDRARAIRQAWLECEAGDLLVIAGKGHEDYQIIGTARHAFSDREVIRQLEGMKTRA